MEINPHQLQIFVAVARERSFLRAAEKLHISQPSVSIQIRKLENSLDRKLFERVRYDVRLTAEG
jgi:DNA-binding transcriptional LysR family regulator